MKHKLSIAFTLMLSLCLTGCPESSFTDMGKHLYETAKMAELEEDDEQARELYQKILDKFPGTHYAELAKTRLKAMDQKK